ncbi:MAG: hypothetical protein ACYDHZ_06980 [Dehalococcoidia bacterium]
MASALFAKAKKAFLDGGIAMLTDTIKAVFVDSADYTIDLVNHQYLSDIPVAARVATSGALANKSTTGGVFDADDITVTAVSGDQFEQIHLFKDTGNASTSPLIACVDTAAGLPCTPNGGDITITWDNGANKIFKL